MATRAVSGGLFSLSGKLRHASAAWLRSASGALAADKFVASAGGLSTRVAQGSLEDDAWPVHALEYPDPGHSPPIQTTCVCMPMCHINTTILELALPGQHILDAMRVPHTVTADQVME